MATAASTMSLLPLSQLKQMQQQRRHAAAGSVLVLGRRKRFVVPRARLFGPAIFEASKLKVLFVGVEEEDSKHPGKLPRTYTLTHSDVTARLTLAVSHTIHAAQLQGWYNRLQRDEVVAEWKKVRGAMSLHVHCHISGGHFLLDAFRPITHGPLPVDVAIAPLASFQRRRPGSVKSSTTSRCTRQRRCNPRRPRLGMPGTSLRPGKVTQRTRRTARGFGVHAQGHNTFGLVLAKIPVYIYVDIPDLSGTSNLLYDPCKAL